MVTLSISARLPSLTRHHRINNNGLNHHAGPGRSEIYNTHQVYNSTDADDDVQANLCDGFLLDLGETEGKCFHHHWHPCVESGRPNQHRPGAWVGQEAATITNCKDRALSFPAVFDRFSCFSPAPTTERRAFSIMQNCNFPFYATTHWQSRPSATTGRRRPSEMKGQAEGRKLFQVDGLSCARNGTNRTEHQQHRRRRDKFEN